MPNRRNTAVAVALALVGLTLSSLGACSTPYQKMGLRGGVGAVQISSNIAQVSARGMTGTDPDKIQRYALRKAAETTLANGYELFEVISVTDRSRSTQGVAGYTGNGIGASGFPQVGLAVPFIRPGETLMIRMSHGSAADHADATIFDARDVLAHLDRKHG
jgi:hypothetical protein